jgi:hypothetical protein
MKIAKSTKERIQQIKVDADRAKRELQTALVRLEEHSGTKRICRPLQKIVRELEAWQQS